MGGFLGGQNAALNLQPFNIPEPATLTMLWIGLAGTAAYRWRRGKVAGA